MWMLLVLFYGLAKGAREIVKKKAMEKSTVMEVLLFYTLLSFVMVIPEIKEAGGVELRFYFLIALKSFFIFVAWICSFKALKKLPLSLYGVLDLSRVLFATLLGIVVLNEILNINQIIGLIFVSTGLIMLKCKPAFLKKIFKLDEYSDINKLSDESLRIMDDKRRDKRRDKKRDKKGDKKEIGSYIYVIAAFVSCLLNALSGLMDKILTKDITSSQLQFWYMLFLLIYYIIYILIAKEKVGISTFKNKWVWILAVLFVLADKALFIANGYPESKVTVMTMIKQSSCIVTILGGKLVFKEKNVGYKLLCAIIIVIGILMSVLL